MSAGLSPMLHQDLIGCPKCDAVYAVRIPELGQKATCARCHTVLISNKYEAGVRTLALAFAVLVLVLAAAFFPFLSINAAGIGNSVSLLGVATSFRSGVLVLVSVTSVLFIVGLPAVRMALLIYVIVPIELQRQPWPFAHRAFAVAQRLKPWAMTEIFAIGCAVALVKVSGLARLEFGPAFWMFIALSVTVVFCERYLCTWSIWNALERDGAQGVQS